MHPPVPREIGYVSILARDNEACGNKTLLIELFGAGPASRLSHPAKVVNIREGPAVGTEMPQRKSHGRNGRIFYLTGTRSLPCFRSAKFRNAELSLQAWFVNHVHP